MSLIERLGPAGSAIVSAPVTPDPRRGILLFAAGIALFSMLNGVVKAQAELFPINEIVFFRNAFALIPILLMLRASGTLPALRTSRLGSHVALSATFMATLFLLFNAYSMMPLADATAIAFTQPLIVTILSVPFAREKVRGVEWVAVAIGFAGVLLVARPSGEGAGLGALLALLGSASGAATMLQQRRLSGLESTHVITFYTLGLSALVLLPTLFVSWSSPTPAQLAGLIAMGLASGVCQYLTVRAFYHAPAATLAPVTYTKMLWAVIIGLVWFGDVPTVAVLSGAAVVIVATLLVMRRERPRSHAAALDPAER
jgi:drug/metabolite transporter (DMT)-like permease